MRLTCFNYKYLYLSLFLVIFPKSNLFCQETIHDIQFDTLDKKITLLTSTQIKSISIDSLSTTEFTSINLPNIKGNEFQLVGDFLVHNSGGLVYDLKENPIRRLDKSFDHRMQYGSHTFIHQDTIFKFGGYGFFQSRNFFTYFSESIKEWEIYPINGSVIPKGTHGFTAIYKNGEYYIFRGQIPNEFDPRKSEFNDHLYHFSFKNKSWEVLGTISDKLKIGNHIIPIGNRDLVISDRVNLLDISSNEINFSNLTDLSRKFTSKHLIGVYQDNLLFLSSDSNGSDKIDKIAVSDIADFNSFEKETFYYPLVSDFKLDETIFLFLSFLLFVVLSSNIFLSRKVVFWRGNYFIKFKKIYFTSKERDLLNLLIKESSDNNVENSQILDLYEEEKNDLDHGTLTRKKNQLIHDLNQKVKGLLNTKMEIVFEKRSSSDTRLKVYFLNKKLIWILK